MDWKPKARIFADSTESEPTKPSELGSVGFEGAASSESPKIETEPALADLAHASAVLNRAGVRIMRLEGQFVIGVWSDLDSPEIRATLRTLDMDRLPMRYKLRRVESEHQRQDQFK
jgi:hypothetical protein